MRSARACSKVIMRFTNRSTNGKRVTVFGYGACGKGTAACFRNAFSVVSVVDIDPVTTLEAHLDGFVTPLREAAIRQRRRARHRHRRARHHRRGRPAAAERRRDPDERRPFSARDRRRRVASQRRSAPRASKAKASRRCISAMAGRSTSSAAGHMANLAGPRPLGNSVESMDLGFTLQARCLELVAQGRPWRRIIASCRCRPRSTRAVASAYLALNR